MRDVEQHGIEVGNMITPYSEFETLANSKYLTAKAFDNRYGCAVAAVEVLKPKMKTLALICTQVLQSKRSRFTWC